MAASAPLPVFQSLEDVYPAAKVPKEEKRWADLTSRFEKAYGAKPTNVARAPGRVNILGEHVDYSLFPVLPAAIEQDILIALRPTADLRVRIANVDPKFAPAEFALKHTEMGWDAGLVPVNEGGGWENYAKVAVLECLQRYFPDGERDGKPPAGLELMMAGNVPPGAGLSSSAAFVVASVIMFLAANGISGLSKGDVVKLAIASEHRMGLRTGGMDQSASALGMANAVLHLSFHPALEATPLPLPPHLAVVITNSLAPHGLVDDAPERYNLRVVEVLIASRLLLHAWGVDAPRLTEAGEAGRIWLREAVDMREKQSSEEEMYARALTDLDRVLGPGGRDARGWTREEMVAASGMSAAAFEETYLSFIPVRCERFQLHKRAQHTFAESLRVARFAALCNAIAADPAAAQGAEAELGQLLNGSHESLRDLFDATVPQVESLRDICLRNGALGARQTGGGWGGAVISLLPADQVPDFVRKVTEQYEGYKGLSAEKLADAAFASMPGSGAGVYKVPSQ